MDAQQLAGEFLKMAAPTRIIAALALIAAGCGAGVWPRGSNVDQAAERPTAVATLGRFTVGSRGRIWGVPEWPLDGQDPPAGSKNPLFTYVTEFQIVATDAANGLPLKAVGVRRIYFHPGGVRIAWVDGSRFVNGEPIAVEQVKFTFEYLPGFAQIKLRMTVHQNVVAFVRLRRPDHRPGGATR